MTDAPQRPAVVLLSGGLDSYTAAAIARADGFALFALTVRYGQVHACELEASRRVARDLGVVRHLEIEVDLAAFGGSSLTGDGAVEQDRPPERPGIPSTYVPARNTVLLSLALGWAEVLGAADLFIGSTPWTTPATPTAAQSTWRRSSARPGSPRGPASRARASASTRP